MASKDFEKILNMNKSEAKINISLHWIVLKFISGEILHSLTKIKKRNRRLEVTGEILKGSELIRMNYDVLYKVH